MKVIPTIDEVLTHAGDATHMALSVEILADTDTPISLYEKLAENEPVSFLLESAEGGENFGRYSFIGFAPSTTFRFAGRRGVIARSGEVRDVHVDDPLAVLAELLGQRRVASRGDLPRFSGGAVGWLGYAGVQYFERVVVPGYPAGVNPGDPSPHRDAVLRASLAPGYPAGVNPADPSPHRDAVLRASLAPGYPAGVNPADPSPHRDAVLRASLAPGYPAGVNPADPSPHRDAVLRASLAPGYPAGVNPADPSPHRDAPAASDIDGFFAIADRVVIVDHLKHRVLLVDHIPLDGDRRAAYAAAVARFDQVLARIMRPLPMSAPFSPSDVEDAPPLAITPSMGRETYMAAVEAGKAAISAGEIFQIVLSQRFSVANAAPPFAIYRALRALNPSPYMFHLAFDDHAIVGASPEVLVRVDHGEILLRPIAGTRKRGATREEDAQLEHDLQTDAKELAEHHMLLDLGRNDVGRVAEIGSVHVERPLHVERYSHVMHLVSDVRGRLAAGKTAFDVLRACFPAGTVSGAPKIRAMELIGALEKTPRGLYSGTVGYFDFSGNMDTCIAIRSMVVEENRVLVQAGAGIVYDSVPEVEHEECLNKARSSFAAIALANARHHAARVETRLEDLPTHPSAAAIARNPERDLGGPRDGAPEPRNSLRPGAGPSPAGLAVDLAFSEDEDPTDEVSTQGIED